LPEAIEAGASDFIMPDLMKCGGVTGWLQVAAQAQPPTFRLSEAFCLRRRAPT
jgi:mandelate racemase